MSPSRDLFVRLAQKYDVENISFPGQPFVEIFGNRRVIIENHRGITGYSCKEISVQVKNGAYMICGGELNVMKMTSTVLVITGRIDSVRFCGGE